MEVTDFEIALEELNFKQKRTDLPKLFHKLWKNQQKRLTYQSFIKKETIQNLQEQISRYENEIKRIIAENEKITKNIISNSHTFATYVTNPKFKESSQLTVEADRTKEILKYYQRISKQLEEELSKAPQKFKPLKQKPSESYKQVVKDYFDALEENYLARCELKELSITNETKAFSLINEIKTIHLLHLN